MQQRIFPSIGILQLTANVKRRAVLAARYHSLWGKSPSNGRQAGSHQRRFSLPFDPFEAIYWSERRANWTASLAGC
jgi:hypothetical protein